MTYILLYGFPPFESGDLKKTYERIKYNDIVFPSNPPISYEAKEFLKEIFILKPSKRLTAREIINHPYINKNSLPSSLPKGVLIKKLTVSDI